MDRVDIILCQRLLANSRVSYKELARDIDLTVPAVYKRIDALVREGIIGGFVTEVDLRVLKGLPVMVYGRSEAPLATLSIEKLSKNDAISSILVAGGNQVYINAFLRSPGDIDGLLEFIRSQGDIPSPCLGIHMIRPEGTRLVGDVGELTALDYRILRSLKNDSRKSSSEVAKEVGVSPRMVRSRLGRMVESSAVRFTIRWSPDFSRDVIALIHLSVRPDRDRGRAMGLVKERFSDNIVFLSAFSNMPDSILLTVWAPSMRGIGDLAESMYATGVFRSITPNLVYSARGLETWKDRVIEERGRLSGKRPASSSETKP